MKTYQKFIIAACAVMVIVTPFKIYQDRKQRDHSVWAEQIEAFRQEDLRQQAIEQAWYEHNVTKYDVNVQMLNDSGYYWTEYLGRPATKEEMTKDYRSLHLEMYNPKNYKFDTTGKGYATHVKVTKREFEEMPQCKNCGRHTNSIHSFSWVTQDGYEIKEEGGKKIIRPNVKYYSIGGECEYCGNERQIFDKKD